MPGFRGVRVWGCQGLGARGVRVWGCQGLGHRLPSLHFILHTTALLAGPRLTLWVDRPVLDDDWDEWREAHISV